MEGWGGRERGMALLAGRLAYLDPVPTPDGPPGPPMPDPGEGEGEPEAEEDPGEEWGEEEWGEVTGTPCTPCIPGTPDIPDNGAAEIDVGPIIICPDVVLGPCEGPWELAAASRMREGPAAPPPPGAGPPALTTTPPPLPDITTVPLPMGAPPGPIIPGPEGP